MLIAFLRRGLLLAAVVASLHVAAAPRFWTLTDVKLSDGAVATGYFSYDDATGTIANWNLRFSGGVGWFTPYTYVPDNSTARSAPDSRRVPLYLYFYSGYAEMAPPLCCWRSLRIFPLAPLDGSSATVSIDVSSSYESFEDYDFAPHQSRDMIAGSLVLTTSQPPLPPVVDANQHGLTGSWYNPETSGQGIQLEVYPNMVAPGTGFLQGGWFTFKDTAPWDYDWEQRWYSFSGNVLAGQASASVTIYQNVGGNFNSLPATSAVPVGTAVLSFADCTSATMTYAFTHGSHGSGAIPLIRLTPNVTCSANGGNSTSADFGYSGNWFDSATSGQGFVFELNPNAEVVFFGWFTYGSMGQLQGAAGQRWYTGQANYLPGARTLPVTLYETFGGSFNEVAATYTRPVGAATVVFHSCHAASLTFNFTGGTNAGALGTINLSRVGPTPGNCLP